MNREQAFWKSCWRRTYLLIIRVMEKEYVESVKYASYQEKQGKYLLQNYVF